VDFFLSVSSYGVFETKSTNEHCGILQVHYQTEAFEEHSCRRIDVIV